MMEVFKKAGFEKAEFKQTHLRHLHPLFRNQIKQKYYGQVWTHRLSLWDIRSQRTTSTRSLRTRASMPNTSTSRYLSIEDLTEILDSNPELKGLNVTIPYKEKVISYLDVVSPEANAIGAVNVVKVEHKGEDDYPQGI